ncbi:MAG: hypothetical protein ACJAVK_000074 [Akkermansiaceae bacterium]|jgi:hypothetical protein
MVKTLARNYGELNGAKAYEQAIALADPEQRLAALKATLEGWKNWREEHLPAVADFVAMRLNSDVKASAESGSVDGQPGAVSCGVLQDDGVFRGALYFDRGGTWFSLGGEVVDTRATSYDSFSDYEFPTASTVTAGQAGTRRYAFDLAVDADFDFYEDAGNDLALVLERIEYSVTLVRAIYLRDAILQLDLGRVIIRATEGQNPYNGLNGGGYLSELRSHWRDLQTDSGHDVVAGVSRRKIGGGLAFVGTIAGSSSASVNQSRSGGAFDIVFRHELGHNWGCGHFVGGRPEGAGLMGGNQPGRLTGCELYRVLRERERKIASLDDEGVFSGVELPFHWKGFRFVARCFGISSRILRRVRPLGRCGLSRCRGKRRGLSWCLRERSAG